MYVHMYVCIYVLCVASTQMIFQRNKLQLFGIESIKYGISCVSLWVGKTSTIRVNFPEEERNRVSQTRPVFLISLFF